MTDFLRTERAWFIVSRWQEYRGEVRANIIRMLAVAVFYAIHLYSGYQRGAAGEPFERAVTSIVIAWSLVVMLVFFCLQRRFFPAWLKYFTTVADIVLLTWIVTLGTGPSSPAVVAYFVIVVMSAVRMQLRLVWCATFCCIVAYGFVVASSVNDWWGNAQFLVGREEVLMVAAGLAVTGIVAGQIVRCALDMTADYVARDESSSTESEP